VISRSHRLRRMLWTGELLSSRSHSRPTVCVLNIQVPADGGWTDGIHLALYSPTENKHPLGTDRDPICQDRRSQCCGLSTVNVGECLFVICQRTIGKDVLCSESEAPRLLCRCAQESSKYQRATCHGLKCDVYYMHPNWQTLRKRGTQSHGPTGVILWSPDYRKFLSALR
jgi:hypothetical protein